MHALIKGALGCVTLLALINGALGWVTLSQARLGAQLADIREQTRGNYTQTTPPMQSLGYLWSRRRPALAVELHGRGIRRCAASCRIAFTRTQCYSSGLIAIC